MKTHYHPIDANVCKVELTAMTIMTHSAGINGLNRLIYSMNPLSPLMVHWQFALLDSAVMMVLQEIKAALAQPKGQKVYARNFPTYPAN